MEQSFLVLRGTPAAVDEELDPVVRGIGCSLAQGTEQNRVEVGYARKLVIEERHAVGDITVSLTKRTTVLTAKTPVLTVKSTVLAAKTTVLTARDVDG
jgi:hypothetical protein